MQKQEELYSGKAKSVFTTSNPDQLVLYFRDDTSAFDGKKREALSRKGMVNNRFNAFVMEQLEESGIHTHFIELLSEQESLVKQLQMFPLECVVRNVAAGSLCKRLGVTPGLELERPIFEFFLKNDDLGDPMVNEYHIRAFEWAEPQYVEQMKKQTFAVNDVLKALFAKAGLILVDYKLEFGLYQGQVVLGDEFTPDGCRVWDAQTREKLDKDRFREDLGGVIEAYELVGRKLGVEFDEALPI